MSEEQQILEMTETINDMYGCDGMYYGVDTYAISAHLYGQKYRKQREGEWTTAFTEDEAKPYCSNCFYGALRNTNGAHVKSNFCPNCGARMRGADGEQKATDC